MPPVMRSRTVRPERVWSINMGAHLATSRPVVIPVLVTGIHSEEPAGIIAVARKPSGVDPRHEGEDDG
jgi:hypothetical protein